MGKEWPSKGAAYVIPPLTSGVLPSQCPLASQYETKTWDQKISQVASYHKVPRLLTCYLAHWVSIYIASRHRILLVMDAFSLMHSVPRASLSNLIFKNYCSATVGKARSQTPEWGRHRYKTELGSVGNTLLEMEQAGESELEGGLGDGGRGLQTALCSRKNRAAAQWRRSWLSVGKEQRWGKAGGHTGRNLLHGVPTATSWTSHKPLRQRLPFQTPWAQPPPFHPYRRCTQVENQLEEPRWQSPATAAGSFSGQMPVL